MLTVTELLEHYYVVRQTFAPLRLTRWQLSKLLAAQLWRDASPLAASAFVTVVALVLMFIVSLFGRPTSLRKLDIPRAVKPRRRGLRLDFKQVLEATAKQHPNSPFLLTAFGVEYVIYPSICFDEIKRLPVTQASAFAFFREIFNAPWTGAGVQTPHLSKTIGSELTRAIPTLVQWRQQDCAAACDMTIGSCPDWKAMTLYATMQDMVASVNASAFVGRELGTDQKWIRAVDRMPMMMAYPTIVLSFLPRFARPFAKPLLFAPLLWIQRSMKKMLMPVLEADIREYETSTDKKNLLGPQEQGKVQLTGWLLARYKGTIDRKLVADLVQDYMSIILESMASSSLTLYFMVLELAADPALQQVLREEVEEVTTGGLLPQTPLNELRKMDSVMRESARMNGFSSLVLYRKILAPVKLSVGPELPVGTKICVDAHHINFSPELWKDPHVFDGMRHYKARQKPENENRFKFASLGSDTPNWGDGMQACPGRWFADNTIKIVLTHLLLTYEFKLRPGEDKPKKSFMPNGTLMPDLWAKVLFKSRKRAEAN